VPAYLYTPTGAQLNPNQIVARLACAVEADTTAMADAGVPTENE